MTLHKRIKYSNINSLCNCWVIKRCFILSILTILFCIKSYSQVNNIKWGKWQSIPEKTTLVEIIGQDDKGFYALRTKDAPPPNIDAEPEETDMWLEYYNLESLDLSFTNEFIMPTVNGLIAKYLKLFYINKKLILLTWVDDTKKQKRLAYIQYINDDGTLKTKPKPIGELPLTTKKTQGKFFATLSKDKTRILFYYSPLFDKYNSEPFTFKIIDENLAITFEKETTMPFTAKQFSLSQCELGPDSTICILAKIVIDPPKQTPSPKAKEIEKNQKENELLPKFSRSLLIYDTATSSFKNIPITAERNTISELKFAFDNDNNIHIFGFYGPATANEITGVFYKKIDIIQKSIIANSKSEFTKEEVLAFSEKRCGDYPREFYNFKILDIIFLKSGQSMFISEQSYIRRKVITDPNTKADRYVYFYNSNDIIASLANKNGKIEWVKRFPKVQFSIDDYGYFSSCAVATSYGNKVKIIYNDNFSNLTAKEASDLKDFKLQRNGSAIVFTLYPDGGSDKIVMFPNPKTLIIPSIFLNYNNKWIIGTIEKKMFNIVQFEFDN